MPDRRTAARHETLSGKVLRGRYLAARAALVEEFWKQRDGLLFSRKHAGLVDSFVLEAFHACKSSDTPPIALVALGGYGRGTLVPFSDLDLVLLYEDTAHVEALETFASQFFAILWDAGFKVSHAAQTPAGLLAAVASEQTVASAFVDARFLAGDTGIAELCMSVFRAWLHNAGKAMFIEAKMRERATRAQRHGTVHGALQPNLKEGIGGLRDVHFLHWLSGTLRNGTGIEHWGLSPAQQTRVQRAWRFFASLRTAVHILAGKPEEKMSFAFHTEAAQRLGYRGDAVKSVTRLRRHLYRHAVFINTLAETLPAEWQQEDTAALLGLDLPALLATTVKNPATHLIALKKLAATDVASPRNGQAFVEYLRQGDMAMLPLLAETGIFSKLCPPFQHTEGLMQFDQVHLLTVDAHTLKAVSTARLYLDGHKADQDPFPAQVASSLSEPTELLLAVLCHDLAKGKPGDHSLLGAAQVRQIAALWDLNPNASSSVAWLVEHHLLMSFHAFKRDIHDAESIQQFVETVQSAERLKLLYLLTVIDMQATNPALYSSWKAGLLAQLYQQALTLLTGGMLASKRQQELSLMTLVKSYPAAEQAAITDAARQLPPGYWTAFTPEQQRRHMALLLRFHAGETIIVDHNNYIEQGYTEITVVMRDALGLFAHLAGAFAYAKADIVDAKIFTLGGGIVLDTFAIQESGSAYKFTDQLERLVSKLMQVLSGAVDMEKTLGAFLQQNSPYRHLPARVMIDNASSSDDTILEINCGDRPGLLFALASVLKALKVQICGAKVSTFAGHAVDIFYVRDAAGFKITHAAKLEAIRGALLAACSPG
ncbi:MAG: HD domain-containing protein [Alphaproteobacteria bacterium]|nr:HD domain-containing protein [Alphaproteobacteria bacterium]